MPNFIDGFMERIRLFTLPNLLTSLNLFCGCLACVEAFGRNYDLVLLLVLLSAVFDFSDGLVARATKQYSAVGLQLDSLADDISFGLVPSVVVFSLFNEMSYTGWAFALKDVIPYAAFLISVFSALRLAKFNVDERQTASFVGLPTPANALFWVALAAGSHAFVMEIGPVWTLLAVLVSSVLLVCELPMFALKFKNLHWRDNMVSYVFIVTSLLLVIFFRTAGIALAICWYVALSVIVFLMKPRHVSH